MQLLQSGGWCTSVSLFNTVHCLPMFFLCQPLPRKALLNTPPPPPSLWDLKGWVKGTVRWKSKNCDKEDNSKRWLQQSRTFIFANKVCYCNFFHGQVKAFEPYDILCAAVQLNLLDKCSVEFSGKAVQDYVTWRVFIWEWFLVLCCCTAIISAPHHPKYTIIISAPLYQQRVNKHSDRIQVAMTVLCHLCGEEGGKTWLYNCLVPVASSGKRNSTVLTYFGAGVPEY